MLGLHHLRILLTLIEDKAGQDERWVHDHFVELKDEIKSMIADHMEAEIAAEAHFEQMKTGKEGFADPGPAISGAEEVKPEKVDVDVEAQKLADAAAAKPALLLIRR